MRRVLAAAMAAWAFASGVQAQQPKVDLNRLSAEIKKLDWKSVDWAALSDLERARALMLLDETIDEIGSQMTAEADLMSEFIDTNNLGPDFATRPAAAPGPVLTVEDAEKVAAALLRGPMSSSTYATAMGGSDQNVPKAYLQMYTSTCNRKWSGALEARQQVRAMSAFLESTGKMAAFNAWVPGEVERRTREHDEEMAKRRSAMQQQAEQERQQRVQAAEERKAQEQQQRAQQSAMEAQQALCAAQQAQQGQAPSGDTSSEGAIYPNWYYGGLGYVGAGAWYRDAAYRGAATARTERRIGGWHGRRR